MSGIAGVVSLDGAPVDPGLPARMAACLAARGPDGTRSWSAGPAGLAHGLLRTGDPGEDVPQPLSLDGRSWIVADARIDGREDLVRALRAADVRVEVDAPAAELILHAVRVWGLDAPARLLGDFSFAVWDAGRRRLFCARDHLGVKPFFYARTFRALVLGNTLDCVRLHPAVSGELDEAWIADFLVHGDTQAHATVYAAIRQLPPAHSLVMEDGHVSLHRYWQLPVEPAALPSTRVRDVVEGGLETLRTAVRDRLPNGSAAFFLSGGRDSTSLAALAVDTVRRGERRTALRGYTAHYARLMPDEERPYTQLAADALGIPVHFLPVDDYAVFGRWDAPELRRPQPTDNVLGAIEADQLRQAAAHARVLITGQGGDPVQRETRSRLTRLAARGRLLRAATEAAQYAWWHRRLPRPGVRTWLAERGGARPWTAEAPAWIAPELARRVGLAERLAAWNAWDVPAHRLRPEAYETLVAPLWQTLFLSYDPGVTGVPLEVRHPFFDLRVISYWLSVPPAQWYNDKGLLRIGMRRFLPEAFLRRPKTPLTGDPLALRRARDGDAWLGGRTIGDEVARWVDVARVPAAMGGRSPAPPVRTWEDVRPLALSLWLAGVNRTR
ncbi:asparagine synthetase B family protein [Longimicrobium sp.]|uniref:asparagine synthetase B family protein n=1 Tax=Longimicrobium sp. TaxID=2029185 RepID=UPI002E304390|nr:asparagine synthase-related protein [Longimicrobium sp.]HEX6039030.1 asparagine synthase-related protein [Longimicrobium sp.]